MTTTAVLTLTALGKLTPGTTAGQQITQIAATIGGDLVPLTGQFTVVILQTFGTTCTWTLDSTLSPAWGTDSDLSIVLAATDLQAILIDNRGSAGGRFDQNNTGGTAGYAKLTPSTVTGVPKITSFNIPS